MKWFGYQIQFKADIDNNGYKDLAISAPGSLNDVYGHGNSNLASVFLYSTRPSLSESVTIKVTNEPIMEGTNDIELVVCGLFNGDGFDDELRLRLVFI